MKGHARSQAWTGFVDPRNERVLGLADEFREDCSFPFSIAVDG